jgi:hypothetical protein
MHRTRIARQQAKLCMRDHVIECEMDRPAHVPSRSGPSSFFLGDATAKGVDGLGLGGGSICTADLSMGVGVCPLRPGWAGDGAGDAKGDAGTLLRTSSVSCSLRTSMVGGGPAICTQTHTDTNATLMSVTCLGSGNYMYAHV